MLFKAIVFALSMFVLFSCTEKKNNPVSYDSFLQTGDIVFRKGSSAESKAVLYADSLGDFSHIGIVVQAADSSFWIIHAVPDQTVKDSIKKEKATDFFAKTMAQRGAIMRFKDQKECAQRAAGYTLRLYDEKRTVFDHDYNLADSTQLYCTELVWRAYLNAGQDISEGRRSTVKVPGYDGLYLLPSDILRHSQLQLIYEFTY